VIVKHVTPKESKLHHPVHVKINSLKKTENVNLVLINAKNVKNKLLTVNHVVVTEKVTIVFVQTDTMTIKLVLIVHHVLTNV